MERGDQDRHGTSDHPSPPVGETLTILCVPRVPGSANVTLHGTCSAATVERFSRTLAKLMSEGVLCISLDLSRLDDIDEAGLRALVVAHERFSDVGGRLVFDDLSPAARLAIEARGLDHVLVIPAGSTLSHSSPSRSSVF